MFLFSTKKIQFNPFTTVPLHPWKKKKKAFFDLLEGNKKRTLGRNGKTSLQDGGNNILRGLCLR